MQTSNINNVIFLKDAESNIIDEAFVILKDNVKIKDVLDSTDNKNNKAKKLCILKEAELLVNQKINQLDFKYQKYKVKKLEQKMKVLKIINVILVISSIILIIIK